MCDADRLETYTTHLAMAVLLPVAFTVGRPPKLGFVKDSDDDLIDVGENEDEKAWMPFRDVVYLAIRAAQARARRQTAVASANGPDSNDRVTTASEEARKLDDLCGERCPGPGGGPAKRRQCQRTRPRDPSR